jgi:hypothetical protein
VSLFIPERLGPKVVVDYLLHAGRGDVAALGSLVLLIRTPVDSEPDFGAALEESVLKSEPVPQSATSLGLATAEIPTVLAPADDESEVDQAEMLAELSSEKHWVVPLSVFLPRRVGETAHAAIAVGRAFDARIRLTDRSVSAHHAEFTLADGGVRLTDLGSKNGTAHNGVDLRPQDKIWLQPMDRVRFGRVECFVCDPRALRAVLRTDIRNFS